jgi:hypothetical protein
LIDQKLTTEDIDNIDLNSELAQDILKDYKAPEEGFDKIGFTRPLGGFFYEFFFAILTGLVVFLTFSWILKALYPYPDSKAYTTVGNVLFSFLFFIANVPTAFALEIFVAKYRVKNPAKMIQYIRFYMWYQMITGILLITGTSIFVIYILKTGNLMYTKWLLLIYISREYPAMTNVFTATLKGLQRFDYQTKVNYAGQVIQPLCEIICVLLGRYVLGANPVFGEIMGIAIGFAIGTYVDDFITMIIGAKFLRKCLKPLGYSIFDTMVPHVSKEVWKESILFGLKLSPPGILSTLLGFFTFFWWYDMVPAYAVLMVLNEAADQIANIVRRGGGLYLKGTISESLSNGKIKLTQYYVAFALKFSFLTMIAIAVILITFMPVITEVMFIAGGLESWMLTIAFITPNIIESTTEQVSSISTDVILGGNKPGFHSFTSILQTVIQFSWDYILLFVLEWPQNAPIITLIWILALRDFPNKIILIIINYTYIQKKLFKIKYKEFLWQTIVAPVPASLAVAAIAAFWFNIVYTPFKLLAGVYVAGGVTILLAVLCLMWIFFPLYTFFGGWDDYGIKVFSNAVEISGPSKILFRPIVKVNKLMVKSPLHNKHPIPYEDAEREADELMRERFVKEKLNDMLLAQNE